MNGTDVSHTRNVLGCHGYCGYLGDPTGECSAGEREE